MSRLPIPSRIRTLFRLPVPGLRRKPRTVPGPYGCYIAAHGFEHVVPPVSRAVANARRLLKPGGVLIFSVPFSLDADTVEHFPDLNDYRIVKTGGRIRLENRCVDGRMQIF